MEINCKRCSKSCQWLLDNKDQFECSHVDCLSRRQIMAMDDLVAYSCNDLDTVVIGYKTTPLELDE